MLGWRRDRFGIGQTSRNKYSIILNVQIRLIVVDIVGRRSEMHLVILARFGNMAQQMANENVCRLLWTDYAAFELLLWNSGRKMILGL